MTQDNDTTGEPDPVFPEEIDSAQELYSEWRDMVSKPGLSEQETFELKMAFYAGMWAVINEAARISCVEDDEVAVGLFGDLYQEIDTDLEGLIDEYRRKENGGRFVH